MIINLIGDCDDRPVLYTIMKMCQSLGDVLLVTGDARLVRLSDTGESMGHYQNCMIGITYEGIDEFWEEMPYDVSDFEYVIVDNIIDGNADVVIYTKGLLESEAEHDNLEYIDDYTTIELFTGGYLDSKTLYRLEEFEAYKTMCPISQKLAQKLAKVLAEPMKTPEKTLLNAALKQTSYHPSKLADTKPAHISKSGNMYQGPRESDKDDKKKKKKWGRK